MLSFYLKQNQMIEYFKKLNFSKINFRTKTELKNISIYKLIKT